MVRWWGIGLSAALVGMGALGHAAPAQQPQQPAQGQPQNPQGYGPGVPAYIQRLLNQPPPLTQAPPPPVQPATQQPAPPPPPPPPVQTQAAPPPEPPAAAPPPRPAAPPAPRLVGSIAGRWDAEETAPNGETKSVSLEFTRQGNSLSGVFRAGADDTPLFEVRETPVNVTFTLVLAGTPYRVLHYAGTRKGNDLTLESPIDGEGVYKITARRVGAPPPPPTPAVAEAPAAPKPEPPTPAKEPPAPQPPAQVASLSPPPPAPAAEPAPPPVPAAAPVATPAPQVQAPTSPPAAVASAAPPRPATAAPAPRVTPPQNNARSGGLDGDWTAEQASAGSAAPVAAKLTFIGDHGTMRVGDDDWPVFEVKRADKNVSFTLVIPGTPYISIHYAGTLEGNALDAASTDEGQGAFKLTARREGGAPEPMPEPMPAPMPQEKAPAAQAPAARVATLIPPAQPQAARPAPQAAPPAPAPAPVATPPAPPPPAPSPAPVAEAAVRAEPTPPPAAAEPIPSSSILGLRAPTLNVPSFTMTPAAPAFSFATAPPPAPAPALQTNLPAATPPPAVATALPAPTLPPPPAAPATPPADEQRLASIAPLLTPQPPIAARPPEPPPSPPRPARAPQKRPVASGPVAKLPLPALRDIAAADTLKLPPMGWASRQRIGTDVDDDAIRQAADALEETRLKAFGYTYVELDDGWQGLRDANGAIAGNEKFPDMKALVDYVHAKGLKFGLLTSAAPISCGGFEGSYGHEAADARAFAAWGVDYVVYDWCGAEKIYTTQNEMQAAYQKMSEALKSTGRAIGFVTAQEGAFNVAAWAPKTGANGWRIGKDIADTWQSMVDGGFAYDDAQGAVPAGRWNDPGLLQTGNGGMTPDEYRMQLNLWAVRAAPMMLGNDVRIMRPETVTLLTNREIIDINQDAAGRPGKRVAKAGQTEVWAKTLADGSIALGLFNHGNSSAPVAVSWEQLGIEGPREARDLWWHASLGRANNRYVVFLTGRTSLLIKLIK